MLPPGSRNLQLIPPYLDQKKVMVETLLFADLCNRVTIPLSEEHLFSQLEMLITTHRMELLSLMTSALRPSFPRPSYSQDLIILITSAATIELMLLTSKTFFFVSSSNFHPVLMETPFFEAVDLFAHFII